MTAWKTNLFLRAVLMSLGAALLCILGAWAFYHFFFKWLILMMYEEKMPHFLNEALGARQDRQSQSKQQFFGQT